MKYWYPEGLEELMRLRGIDPATVAELHYTQKLNETPKLTVRLRCDVQRVDIKIHPVELPK